MTQILYNLHTDGDQYRITKFADGEVESTYLCSEAECECPAGHRPTCRHRQMLPQMLHDGICNTHWFLDWDNKGGVVDFEGNPRTVAEGPLAKTQPEPQYEQIEDLDTTIEILPADPFNQRSLGDALRAANIPGVTVVDLGDPQVLHDTIANAVGEPASAPLEGEILPPLKPITVRTQLPPASWRRL